MKFTELKKLSIAEITAHAKFWLSREWKGKIPSRKNRSFRLVNQKILLESYDEAGNFSWVMSTILVKYWDPNTESGRQALWQHLDGTEGFAAYVGSDFPELSVEVLAMVHKIRLMVDYIMNGSGVGDSNLRTVNSYKHSLFEGPVTVDMSTIPVGSNFGALPTSVVEAGIMTYLSTLRTLLTKNSHWTEAIAKALWLYGTDGTFDPDAYDPHYSVHAFTGYLHIHVSTKNVHVHHVYIRVAGSLTWEAPIQFTGANFDLHRTIGTNPQNLEVMLIGVINNVETPTASVITPVTYKTSI